jgi:hypothetical protein
MNGAVPISQSDPDYPRRSQRRLQIVPAGRLRGAAPEEVPTVDGLGHHRSACSTAFITLMRAATNGFPCMLCADGLRCPPGDPAYRPLFLSVLPR